MYCPECRSEYVDGIYRCAQCQVDLIAKPPPPDPRLPEFVDYEEVLQTWSPSDIAFLKSFLDSENIGYFFKGERFLHMRPLADPVRLMVRTDQVKMVFEMLKGVSLSFTGISMDAVTNPAKRVLYVGLMFVFPWLGIFIP
ncbi:hypothetical protein LJC22_04140 [Desulfosarcina sp. OttesenSCG-928-G10]|nr:hypothetical protein [Desulfosarcina sp. OttesenSCG-928-G10]